MQQNKTYRITYLYVNKKIGDLEYFKKQVSELEIYKLSSEEIITTKNHKLEELIAQVDELITQTKIVVKRNEKLTTQNEELKRTNMSLLGKQLELEKELKLYILNDNHT